MKTITPLILCTLLSNIAFAENTPDALTLAPNNFVILPIRLAPQVLQQCSRDTPHADSFWMPEQTQIMQLEQQLVSFIHLKKKNSFNTPIFQAYDRQYIGIIQNHKKLIYGNYFPSTYSKNKILEHHEVTVSNVCDGIGHFWGVAYNPATQQFSELRVNGLSSEADAH